jgi:hypothetical protein
VSEVRAPCPVTQHIVPFLLCRIMQRIAPRSLLQMIVHGDWKRINKLSLVVLTINVINLEF